MSVPMTPAGLQELRDELDRLIRERAEIAERLRDARIYGSGSGNDEHLAIQEEQMLLEARIAALEDTLARAEVIEPDGDGPTVAAIGSTVLIEDMTTGAVSQYRLVGAHQPLGPGTISAASPMGRALIGSAPGAVVTIELPNGRSRTVRLAEVIEPDAIAA